MALQRLADSTIVTPQLACDEPTRNSDIASQNSSMASDEMLLSSE